MADEILFELLHMQVVQRIYKVYRHNEQEYGDISISKLEALGFRVGQSLVERLTKDVPRFKDELDGMKFICKDFWTAVYKKQIDNLRTNHQGVYVLQDNRFRLLTQMSNSKQFMEEAPKYLALPCGLIRGALANLGIISVVTADVTTMPACEY
ncbi:hypothetical protein CAPTEDRAFT_126805 [Capitella teleta]|uniref:Trafficking protein particle complex subunit 6B n=1 Tax=Capitella teleta TaxID=283909 RepID=R7TME7_CAPTE|nr:hypothetical protein CAPTEDRAFT_126805 [Capitella teleta]|eukprot:ELT95033.1 hypothetical protein CAPTEDRAFT_126805 [Capitella teleta]